MITHTEKVLESKAKLALKKLLLSQSDTDEKELNDLVDKFELVSFKKNHLILKEGELHQHFYFIYKGIVRMFFYKNRKLVIERFEKEGGFFGINYSQLVDMPGIHNFETMEDSVMLRIKHADFGKLCHRYHSIERLYRINLELLHSNYVKRFYTFSSMTSEERYHQFMHEYGDIGNRVPLKFIANYLGMTSETLSRIRAKYDKSFRPTS